MDSAEVSGATDKGKIEDVRGGREGVSAFVSTCCSTFLQGGRGGRT